jgi:hypothetical protein
MPRPLSLAATRMTTAACAVVVAATGAAVAAPPAGSATRPACHLITRGEAQRALGGPARLTRGEDATLCNVLYGRPQRDVIMAFKPNVRGRLGFAAQRRAYRTRTVRDGLGTTARFTQTPLAIPGVVGFEAEVVRTLAFDPEPPPPDRYLILLRHGKILSLETTPARATPSFAQLERVARFAIKRF